MDYDAIILGAGGAGLMAAATAGQAGARVLLLDHAKEPGRKILISGGGRCNFTNMEAGADRFLSENPHFAKSALKRYSQWDFLALVERHGVAWHEKTLGQLFCDGSARQIVALLMEECRAGDVTLRLSTSVGEIAHRDGRFHVGGDRAPRLVVATGGPSIPKMGASDRAYAIASQFGLALVAPRPALVPLTLGPADRTFRQMAGVSCPVTARAGGAAFSEAALFTHKGLSGPAILQASSYWAPGEAIELALVARDGVGAGERLRAAKRETPRASLKSVLAEWLPARLAGVMAERIGLEGRLGDAPDAALDDAGATLENLTLHPSGTEGYAKAEVTAGGVDTAELSSKTMEARRVPGLYVVGEAVDVTGWLGGYNFQWAWSSGVAAGRAIAAECTARA